MLAHVASAEWLVAAENATGNDHRMDLPHHTQHHLYHTRGGNRRAYRVSGDATQGINAGADSVLFRSLGKAQVMGDLAGEAKIISDAQTGKVLGVHLIGAHATDLIAEGTLAIQAGLTTYDLSKTIHAHPTLAEAMFEVSLKSIDHALHG
jgi:dihydrolipoamide dehydrogenase